MHSSPVLDCFALVTTNSLAKHGPACTCHALPSKSNITEVPDRIAPVSDRKGRALAWNLISFCPQSCHLLLQLIPANSPPAHVTMSVFPTAFFLAVQHLADFVCPLGWHPSLNMHCTPQDDIVVFMLYITKYTLLYIVKGKIYGCVVDMDVGMMYVRAILVLCATMHVQLLGAKQHIRNTGFSAAPS